ncbi:fasciclin domain-containing protein [Botrimarina mediterranea]|uniref:Immunogenic protein MPT70 n=1 Tax=Botrimarina mediterranea TaxID=2528022 RepID=A0A518K6Q4_9BACT|nr:fasciclin domain-containing protein [Botrimarina mediterranea]QDV73464.1 Immunogenic protein MPT70 precursor [Botrimarina mediterranea]QDV77981.1 Immunogenic protein MPT70 precursor [Planctomycetes bacterium K2D]
MKTQLLIAAAVLTTAPLAQAGETCPMQAAAATAANAQETLHPVAAVAAKKDIVDTAVGAEDFTTLVAAVKAAGLVETLKGEGPFTVFAPTDKAFAKVDKATLESLLKPENKEKLTAILTYHVIPGKVMAADAVKLAGKEAETVNGKKAKIEVNGDVVTIAGSKIIATDIECTNGVIHVIDTVMMP